MRVQLEGDARVAFVVLDANDGAFGSELHLRLRKLHLEDDSASELVNSRDLEVHPRGADVARDRGRAIAKLHGQRERFSLFDAVFGHVINVGGERPGANSRFVPIVPRTRSALRLV